MLITTNSKYFYLGFFILVFYFFSIYPALSIGFYQDDYYHYLFLGKYWDGNASLALSQDQIILGYRPLWQLQRMYFYELFGDNFKAIRLFLISFNLLYGLMLYGILRLLKYNHTIPLFSLLLYFSSNICREHIYRVSVFSLSDFLTIFIIFTFFLGLYNKISSKKFFFILIIINGINVFIKESGISSILNTFLLLFIFKKDMSNRKFFSIICSHIFLLIVYFFNYISYSNTLLDSGQNISIIKFSVENAQHQMLQIIKGLILSIFSPMSSAYLSLRSMDVDFIFIVFVIGILFIIVFKMILDFYSIIRLQGRTLLKKFWLLCIVCIFLMAINLSPHIFGRWFENRMLITTNIIGVFIWSIFFGTVFNFYVKENNKVMKFVSLYTVLLLCMISSLHPIPKKVFDQINTGQELIKIIEQSELREEPGVNLIGFPSKGSNLRVRNAIGLARYYSKSNYDVKHFESVEKCDDTSNILVKYDEKEGLIILSN